MGRPKKENTWKDIDGGAAFSIPYTTIRHPNFLRLSPHAHKLLFDLGRQFTGFNNGFLCASWSLMKDAGWKSTHTLRNATLELEHYHLILRTQQGGLNKPNLHAFTFRRINEKAGRTLDVGPTLSSPDSWKVEVPDFAKPTPKPRKRRPAPQLRVAA